MTEWGGETPFRNKELVENSENWILMKNLDILCFQSDFNCFSGLTEKEKDRKLEYNNNSYNNNHNHIITTTSTRTTTATITKQQSQIHN